MTCSSDCFRRSEISESHNIYQETFWSESWGAVWRLDLAHLGLNNWSNLKHIKCENTAKPRCSPMHILQSQSPSKCSLQKRTWLWALQCCSTRTCLIWWDLCREVSSNTCCSKKAGMFSQGVTWEFSTLASVYRGTKYSLNEQCSKPENIELTPTHVLDGFCETAAQQLLQEGKWSLRSKGQNTTWRQKQSWRHS